MEEYYTPLRLPINEFFNTVKDQLWVKRPRPIHYNPASPEWKSVIPSTTVKDTKSSTARASVDTWKSLFAKTFSKKIHPHPRATSNAGESSAPPLI